MSTRSAVRNRPQKHKNKTAWKPDKFKTDTKTKQVQGIVVTNCCSHCTGVIKWKIDYGKYKPLSQPGKCSNCHEKRVKSAYHILCTPCVKELDVCAKCGKKEEVVNTPTPSQEEAIKLKQELERELKLLPERKRRTFLRQLQKEEAFVLKPPKPSEDSDEEATAAPPPVSDKTIGEVRQQALEKLRALVDKYGKDKDDFDLEDDLDDLDLSDEEDEDDF